MSPDAAPARRGLRLLATVGVLLVSACSAQTVTAGSAQPAHLPVPPARAAFDDTVTAVWHLADSFDIHSDGTCSGRSSNAGMADGAKVRVRSETEGGNSSTTATARVKQNPPRIYNGVNGHWVDDDGVYCVVQATFAPAIPDPEGNYLVKFNGEDWSASVSVSSKFWMYDSLGPPGYGKSSTVVLTCTSLADPPDKECPEPTR